MEFGDNPRILRPLEGKTGQALPSGGFFLISNGAASAEFTAPATGDYLIRVTAWETHAGDENARLSLHIDKRAIKELDVRAPREGAAGVPRAGALHAGGFIASRCTSLTTTT